MSRRKLIFCRAGASPWLGTRHRFFVPLGAGESSLAGNSGYGLLYCTASYVGCAWGTSALSGRQRRPQQSCAHEAGAAPSLGKTRNDGRNLNA
jgi:hypothetical protein